MSHNSNTRRKIFSNLSVFPWFLFSLFVAIPLLSSAQEDPKNLVEYSPEFKFKEGIYLSFDQWKHNKPLTKQRIVTKTDANDFEYFVKILSEENLQYFDDYGVQQTMKVSEIWGYCRKGMIFINWHGEFSRVPVIGSITYFAAMISVSGTRFQDPFDPYYPAMTIGDNTQEEIRQYILDFESGTVLDFNTHNIEELLKKDPELFNEYKSLKKKKKRMLALSYIRKFNSAYPVSFPLN
ncbi:MAG: hypothetical protein A2275_11040 [Bacteroidetes bacterium RIFOXYA12_FULL_35_11]|nr:MAG: hypothetical protein A2X01_16080 [Bacteroidetes bacterium GWF2_35_48]OFY77349.1 MAG: hypothetical protein A2275_11040 [Bacteroidetes bacterium RIFOXYA12_FULL_35_11]OFY94837.1 MAG: hypothetical protein A2309_07635 [Bacteroidetes bacterium RIFOXYB2_FULL_35_7]OFY99765.1 MAG: hypothetical protein A2491_10980 [Bacteroidetes bacterium RIFOXYC12_FULL_35_7]HBX50914.1 hypothetical protein [Bacteroidales bacterium]